jgi:Protein of unknown function (DUF2934)
MKSPQHLREDAARFRRLKSSTVDPRIIEAIDGLVEEYEATVGKLENEATASERVRRIRERAYRMWEEQGRPDGLHAQHWHDAEGEEEETEASD